MPANLIPVSEATRGLLSELTARTGLPSTEIVSAALQEYRQRLTTQPVEPVKEIHGVEPAEIWEAAREEESGKLIDQDVVFARLRQRK